MGKSESHRGGERMDRISDLPDGIITHILSFLSTDEAASTSLLSKRWRHMFAFSPNLQFTFDDPNRWNSVFHKRNFIDFVDRVLAVSGNSAVRRFTLKRTQAIGSAHTNRWIRNVLSRGGLLDLDLRIYDHDSIPFEVFSCKTLVNLKLGCGFEIHMPPTNTKTTSLPALKYFSLYLPHFDNLAVYEKLVSTCPVLEEFIIDPIHWPLCIWPSILSVPSLKRLTIKIFCKDLGSMSFDHPNLVYLNYVGSAQLKYPVVNLDSLVEAKLAFSRQGVDFNSYDLLRLVDGLKNVKFLNLACPLTLEIFMNVSEAMPVFKNLIHLSISTDEHDRIGVSYLPSILKKFPNLQTLVIQGLLFDDDDFCKCTLRCSCLVSCAVKVLELTEYKGSINELGLMKRFLEELSCLELVKICVSTKDGHEMSRVTEDLLMLPRASSKCKIQIESVET